jgi:nucleotide-binding universal stress UspA family protein
MRFGIKNFEHSEFWELKGTSVPETLHEFFTHRVACDLLVIGSRGVSSMRRVLTGSVSTGIIDAVDVPCLVVRATAFVQEAPPFRLPTPAGQELAQPLAHPSRSRQIAFALDGSDVSSIIVTWALKSFLRRDDYVTLLHSPFGLDDFDGVRAAAQVAKCAEQVQQLLGTSAEAKQRVQQVRLEENVEPKEALAQAVEKNGPFDVLVTGSRGYGTLARLRERVTGHGSVSTFLLQYACCPVLVLTRRSLVEWLDKIPLLPSTPTKAKPESPGTAR